MRSPSTRLSASFWRDFALPPELEDEVSGTMVSVSESESIAMGSDMFWPVLEAELGTGEGPFGRDILVDVELERFDGKIEEED
jgi:hypothetical protein